MQRAFIYSSLKMHTSHQTAPTKADNLLQHMWHTPLTGTQIKRTLLNEPAYLSLWRSTSSFALLPCCCCGTASSLTLLKLLQTLSGLFTAFYNQANLLIANLGGALACSNLLKAFLWNAGITAVLHQALVSVYCVFALFGHCLRGFRLSKVCVW